MKQLFLFLTMLALTLASPALAQEATNSENLTEKIKERLQETAGEGLAAIKENLEKKSTQPRKKAFVGSVTDIQDSLITLEFKGQQYQVELTDDTDFIKTSASQLETDDFIIAMGFVFPDKQALVAYKVTYISDPQSPQLRQLISGKIKEVDGSKIAADGKTLTVTNKTDFQIKGIEDAELEDLQLEDNLFAIVTLDKNGDIDEVNNILVLPGKNNPASQAPTNAEATQSADTEAVEE